MKPAPFILAGIAASAALAALWHAPLGAGDRFAARAERVSRDTLVHWERPMNQARIARAPMTRTLVLSGPADDFQRSEMVRILRGVPGVAAVHWTDDRAAAQRQRRLPLAAEAILLALLGFSLGLLLAYLVELRRRARRFDRY